MCFLLFIIIDTAVKMQSSLLLLEQTSTPPRDFEQMLISLQMYMEEFEFPNFNAIEEGLLEDLVHVKHCAGNLEKYDEEMKRVPTIVSFDSSGVFTSTQNPQQVYWCHLITFSVVSTGVSTCRKM